MTKKILPDTSLNDAIRCIAAGDTGAASVIAMLNRKRPHNIMGYLHVLDGLGIYGIDIYNKYWDECGGNSNAFIRSLSK